MHGSLRHLDARVVGVVKGLKRRAMRVLEAVVPPPPVPLGPGNDAHFLEPSDATALFASVVVPELSSNLCDALDRQTHRAFEIVVEPNVERALEMAIGRVIVFVDTDRSPHPTWLASHLAWHAAGFVVVSPAPIADPRAPHLSIDLGNVSMPSTDVSGAPMDRLYALLRQGAYFIEDARTAAGGQRRAEPAWKPSTPKVSVYIPAYNAATWIAQTVRSALAQTLEDLEVCISDDGSTDDTFAILEREFSNEPRVRFVSQRNAGIAAASNRAVSMCEGEYILQLDADDELLPHAAERLASALDSDADLALVYAGHEIVDPRGLLYWQKAHIPPPYDPVAHLYVQVATHPRMFRARDFHRTDGFDETLENAVDYDLCLKLTEVGEVRAIPEVLYRYRIHGANTSHAKRAKQDENHVRVIENALLRRGLDLEVVVPDPERKPRRVVFRAR